MPSPQALNQDLLTVALAQIAPLWLNREATIIKIVDYIGRAAALLLSEKRYYPAIRSGWN